MIILPIYPRSDILEFIPYTPLKYSCKPIRNLIIAINLPCATKIFQKNIKLPPFCISYAKF